MELLKLPESECTHRCQSTQHGQILTSALSLRGISSSVVISYMRWLCGNCGQVADGLGRSALHLAASCGCCEVARWLIRHCSANINLKDSESGYTPLHRSVFYGQIHVATSLIQLGAGLTCLDHDDLTALDQAMKDKMPHVDFSLNNPCEVYTWGTNYNYTLGIGNQRDRSIPEIVECFRKQNISIRQVAMHKFHSVFVAHDGRVFSCGHGQGGRLGRNEKAALLPGQMMLTPSMAGTDAHVVAASVGRDHTVLLTEGGTVWTCGLNTHHQLGHSPPPASLSTPKALSPRVVRGLGAVQGVCAGRFHTVIWSPKGVLTCGLHAGQLGHSKGSEVTMVVPRMVTSVSHKDWQITHVAASDGATVVATQKGDVFILYEYQCRRIASRLLDVVKVVVMGGHLDSKVDASVLMDQGGDQLKIAVLTSTGKFLLWQESSQQMVRCMFSLNRPLNITDVALSRGSAMLLITKDGEAFEGEHKVRKQKKAQGSAASSMSGSSAFHEFLDRSDCEQVRVRRLLHIHRAVSVSSDPKGQNCAIIQTHPQAALLEVPMVETSEMREQMKVLLQDSCPQDTVHDVVFLVGSREFAAHRFVVASQSEPLAKLMESKIVDSGEVLRVKISNVKPEVFEQILLYIYSGECDLLKPGSCCLLSSNNESKENEELLDINCISAYSVYSGESNNKKTKNKQSQKNQSQKKPDNDPVRILQETARRFGLTSLQKKLAHVKYENDVIVTKSSDCMQATDITFDNKKHQNLYDVTVLSEDGKEVKAHKCMLIARLEYFNSMLNHGWLEASRSNVLRLPIPHNVLELLVEFLYKDDSSVIRKSDNVDLVCNVLVVADQFFVNRLKEICEVTLAGLITLRSVAIVLQFAVTYNANQLKQCCMQYICLNLPAVLEIRGLENVDDSILEELSKYYRDFNPVMSSRVITPYSNAPSHSLVEAVAQAYPVASNDNEDSDVFELSSKKNLKSIKKKARVRKTSVNDTNKINERNRNESFSSNHSGNSDEDVKQSLSLNDFTERKNADDVTLELRDLEIGKEQGSPEKWVKVANSNSKHSKGVQGRVAAIVKAQDTVKHEQGNNVFTTLSQREKSSPQSVPAQKQQQQIICASPSPPANLSLPVPSSPPNLISDFPDLSSPSSSHETHHRNVRKTPETKSHTKISQKQRKKMAMDALEHVEKVNNSTQFAWSLSGEVSKSSLTDIMREEAHHLSRHSAPIPVTPNCSSGCLSQITESPSTSNPWLKCHSSPEGSLETKFCDIVADEKKQRENWTKMRAKPLELTQLEDKAIEDLLVFYNATGVSEERITVRRVVTGTIATPTWITSYH